jgi:ankyrin repeat protein
MCEGTEELLRFFLDRGADINWRTNKRETPLHLLLRKECFQAAEVLVDYKPDPRARDQDGRTALFIAVEYGAREVARRLLELGAHPNAKDYSGSFPLARALYRGDVEMARFLLEHGADVTYKDYLGRRIDSGWILPWTKSRPPEKVEAMKELLRQYGTVD